MVKKDWINSKIVFFSLVIFGIIFLLNLEFVFGGHTSSPSSATANQSQNYFFNITINNTGDAIDGNITQINVTLPSGFTLVADSNGTDTLQIANFSNSSTRALSWKNLSYWLINGTKNNTNFWFNATISSTLASGYYNISIISTNITGTTSHQTNLSVKVNDLTAPVITLISPTDSNSTLNAPSVTFRFNVTDYSTISNCSLIFNGAISNVNSSVVNNTGGAATFTNLSYSVGNTWSVNCTDIDNNQANSSTRSFSLVSFQFNGTTKDENGNFLNNSVINVTIRDGMWNALSYVSGTSNASGWFNFSIASNNSWFYEPSILHSNASANYVDFKSKIIPSFPSAMLVMLAGTTFYLQPAGTINITAINATANRIAFMYQVKDTKLGYPIAQNFLTHVTEAVVYVPKNRNYSIMIYPNQSMPISFNWNNFAATTLTNVTNSNGNNISRYDVWNSTLHKQFNITLTLARITGNVSRLSWTNWTNLTIIPFLMEPGNMIHAEYGDMPYNLSGAIQSTDVYINDSGWFNISVPSTVETSNIMLFASAVANNSRYFGGFRNISLSYPTNNATLNFTMYGLLGSAGNITMDRIDGAGQNIAIPVAKQSFNLVNATNSTLGSVSAHIEVIIDYSGAEFNSTEFTWMTDVAQSSSSAVFYIPMLNITGFKEMNAYVSGGPSGGEGQYAPKRVSTTSASAIQSNNNITINLFNPGGIDGAIASGSISIGLYISNSSCDVPSPVSSCILGSSQEEQTMSDFNPMRAVMGGGKISFRMGTGNISVHYVNVDMLASGPPDALFDNSTNNAASGNSFSSALRFGSQGPTIYDYVLISIPYSESAGIGLNDGSDVNISIPVFYDDNWNVIWNSSTNGTNASPLAGNFSHYSNYQSDWANLLNQTTCTIAAITSSAQVNASKPCFINTTTNRIWIRLPHFSGTGPSITGNTIPAASTTTTSSSSGSGGQPQQFWAKTIPANDKELSEKGEIANELAAKERVSIKVSGETHYVGVISIVNNKVTINVSSMPQTATLGVGESARFEVTNDNYYDLKATLKSLLNNKANISIVAINEKVAQIETPTGNETITPLITSTNQTGQIQEGENKASKPILILVIAVIVIIIIIALLFSKFSRGKVKLNSKVKISSASKSIKVH